MSVEAALWNKLKTNAGIVAICATRIYPVTIPQAAPGATNIPAITYQRISTPRVRSLSGPSLLAYPRFQITSWHTTYTGAKALGEAVRAAMDGWAGVEVGWTISDSALEDERDIFDPSTELDTNRRYGVAQDFIIWHVET